MLIEHAVKSDAADLATLINLAGEGIPEYLWSAMAEQGESPQDVGARRAARDEGGFSYKNARVIRMNDTVAGMAISYRLDDPYCLDDLDDYPLVVRPLVTLEAMRPGSWYVNAVATKSDYRGLGIASTLLIEAEQLAKAQGVADIALIVASENVAAKRLYLNLGYESVASRPVEPYPQALHGGDWELMAKPLCVESRCAGE